MKRMLILGMAVLTLGVSFSRASPAENAVAGQEQADHAKELQQLRPLADEGNAIAQFNLGVMYDVGRGVAQDYAQAVHWYRLAAMQGHAAAQFNLGGMYAQGQGLPQDFVRAHLWFNLAAVAGYAGAAKNRNSIARLMNPQQIDEAQKMARACQQRNFNECD
ncbi:MAG: sel1 repeat family protein [Rhodoferax sp.]|nr:sel1 repeat family protein [Rhodoferax sp.]